jgi:hypothetical protein
MTQIMPSLFLEDVNSSFSRELIRENHIIAVVCLTNAQWAWWYGTGQAGIPTVPRSYLEYQNGIC